MDGERDWVRLKLLNPPAASLMSHVKGKPAPWFYGPFQLVAHIGDIAYCLHLPLGAKIHDIFHVGVLKQFNGQPPQLPPILDGRAIPTPTQVVRSRFAHGEWQVLVGLASDLA